MPDPADAKEYARPRAEAAGLHWPTYEAQIDKESGWRHWSAPGVVKSSPTGSMGLGQLNSKFYTREEWEDPYRNLDTSIGVMAGYVRKFGTYRKALGAYNWGPANVGGYTDSAGRTHPAWDGTRAWRCPYEAVVAQCRTAQRDRYLDAVLGTEWKEPNMAPPASGIVYEDFRDPAPAGRFAATPKGVVLHGSRSGKAGNPKAVEALGTARWEQNNPDGLGWHATIGERWVAVHLTPQEWGWHAKAASPVYLGVEFAQATVDEPITDAQVEAFADWLKTRILPALPRLPMHFPSHAEVDREFNQVQGKTDPFAFGDRRMIELRSRITAALGKEAPPANEYSVGPGILAAMKEHGDSPASDELFFKRDTRDAWSEAFGTSGARYIWLPSAGRVFRYEPAA